MVHDRTRCRPRRRRFPHRCSTWSMAVLFLPLLRPFARLLVMAAAGARDAGRSVKADLSRRGRARDAGHRAGRRGARGAAHGRCARSDAARRARCARPRRPQPGRRDQGARRRARPPQPRDQGLPDRARPGFARRRRQSPPGGNPRLHHQSRACRRHRRKGSDGDRRQAAEARPRLLGRGPGRNPRDARAARRQCAAPRPRCS